MKNDLKTLNVKRGYLTEDFKFFHLKDQKNMAFESHYHDFNKMLIFISGKVTYLIEGKAYKLKPWDIILVSHKEIHKPIIEPVEPYERIVIWVNPAFLEKHSSSESDLSTCFALASQRQHNLLRLRPESLGLIRVILSQLEEACQSRKFGSRILKNSLFMQFAVYLNREFLESSKNNTLNDIEYDENIGRIITFINENLEKDLSIGRLSSRFYISKYYLMHKFKKQTGYSVHNYILQKRLLMANTLVKTGKPAMEVSIECGFGDYSNFVRAFKKMFGLSPRNYYKNLLQFEKTSPADKHF